MKSNSGITFEEFKSETTNEDSNSDIKLGEADSETPNEDSNSNITFEEFKFEDTNEDFDHEIENNETFDLSKPLNFFESIKQEELELVDKLEKIEESPVILSLNDQIKNLKNDYIDTFNKIESLQKRIIFEKLQALKSLDENEKTVDRLQQDIKNANQEITVLEEQLKDLSDANAKNIVSPMMPPPPAPIFDLANLNIRKSSEIIQPASDAQSDASSKKDSTPKGVPVTLDTLKNTLKGLKRERRRRLFQLNFLIQKKRIPLMITPLMVYLLLNA